MHENYYDDENVDSSSDNEEYDYVQMNSLNEVINIPLSTIDHYIDDQGFFTRFDTLMFIKEVFNLVQVNLELLDNVNYEMVKLQDKWTLKVSFKYFDLRQKQIV